MEVFNMGIEKIGTLRSRFKVYRDPYMPSYLMLVGHKGSTFLEAGYVYAPYVPLQLTPLVFDNETFVPAKGIMTRYAKKMVNNRYFGVITIRGIQVFNLDTLR